MKLKNSGIGHFFTEVVTSEQSGIMKPHAAIFEYALTKTGTSADKSIMVGDTLEVDILGALNAGMDAAYYNPTVPHTSKIKPTYVLANLGELMHIL